jgi:hypothetical protein
VLPSQTTPSGLQEITISGKGIGILLSLKGVIPPPFQSSSYGPGIGGVAVQTLPWAP